MYVIITHIFTHIHILYFGSRWMMFFFCCCILEKFWYCFFIFIFTFLYKTMVVSIDEKIHFKKTRGFLFDVYKKVLVRESPIQIQFFLLFKFLFGSTFFYQTHFSKIFLIKLSLSTIFIITM